jgi:hypothetical protein
LQRLNLKQMVKFFENITLLFCMAGAQNCFAQPTPIEQSIVQHTTNIDSLNASDKRLAGIFKSQKLVLIGEIHGTAEPAEFVEYLVKNLTGTGRNIYVGIEAQPFEMPNEKQLRDTTALKHCRFFKNDQDGKSSQAWFNLISDLIQMHGVNLFFFDLSEKQAASGLHHRDSLMYINIKSKMLRDTGALYICLTGNYHNILSGNLLPVPMGYYLLRDKGLKLSLSNMVSFNHFSVIGGQNCNTGDGARLHTINNNDYYYNLTSLRNYFSITPELINDEYNGILFTYHVTASFGVQ